jgi:ATP-dependent helicase HrpB
MARLPLHPRLSRLMLRAKELGCVSLGADLAALVTERDIFRYSAAAHIIDDPDFTERVDALRAWRRKTSAGSGADQSALRSVERTATQLKHLMPEATGGDAADPGTMSRLLLAAFPDRVCKRRSEGGGRFVHMQGRGVRLSKDSHLGDSPYIIAVSVDAGERAEGFVHLAAPVTEELLRAECADRIETVRSVAWDRKENRVAAAQEERYGSLLLSSRTFMPGDDEAAPILCEAIRTTPNMLTFSGEARRFQGRVELLKKVFSEEPWPDLSDAQLLSRPETWLMPWLGGIRTGQQLSGLNILPALRARLTREQSRLLEERAPTAIGVPSGSRVMIDYTAGSQPVLAVKLQEMFGLADTPTIAGNRVKLLLHLLSPARRPVQITQDLKGFWNSSYPLVKKDLKGRYPKHPWPDDPWNAVPTRRAKRRGT